MEFLGFTLILAVLFLLVWHETGHYGRLKLQRKDTMAARARLGRRLLGIVILLTVTVMTYVGIQNLRAFHSPALFALYWTLCILLIIVLIVLVLFDLHAVFRQAMAAYTDESAEEKRFRDFMEKQLRTEVSKRSPIKKIDG